jgi:predicted metal-binding membrane protein
VHTHFAGERESSRDRPARLAPAIPLLAVAAACWAIAAHRMQGMDMGPGTELGGVGWFAGLWATMMAAMMLPSLVPVAVGCARANRADGAPARTTATIAFTCGYLLTWLGAGVLAYGVITGVRSLEMSWLAWDQGGRSLAAGVILAAALYELTPAKSRCLRHCRHPELLTSRWRPGVSGALLTGLEHGGFCVGASWALMAALFALGVMSLTWMIVMAALVAIEKLLPWRGVAVAATITVVTALGLAVAFAPQRVPGLTVPGHGAALMMR